MTREDIIRVAREAGWRESFTPSVAIYRFADLVAEYEREQCAAVCDRMTDLEDGWRPNTPSDCAAAIRARSKA